MSVNRYRLLPDFEDDPGCQTVSWQALSQVSPKGLLTQTWVDRTVPDILNLKIGSILLYGYQTGKVPYGPLTVMSSNLPPSELCITPNYNDIILSEGIWQTENFAFQKLDSEKVTFNLYSLVMGPKFALCKTSDGYIFSPRPQPVTIEHTDDCHLMAHCTDGTSEYLIFEDLQGPYARLVGSKDPRSQKFQIDPFKYPTRPKPKKHSHHRSVKKFY